MTFLPDPRFTTAHTSDAKYNHHPQVFYLPPTVEEKWCRPGYQPKRPDKGFDLTVNDYPFHPIQYGGANWSQVVHTPFHTNN
jgi:hypothetical protein